jgi:enterochelin esterase-like enzyme
MQGGHVEFMGGERRRVRRHRRPVRLVLLLIAVAALAWVVVLLVHRFWPGRVHTGSAAAHGATIVRYDIKSHFVHETLPQTAAIPPGGGKGRPLLVFLHGRGRDGNESNSNGPFYDALRKQGSRAPVVVFPNGGDHSYFHKRKSGDWARYVLDEVIPQATTRLHTDPHRIAIGGVSMGGFGAFDIARQQPAEFCAVGGHSAAMWLHSGDTAPGAFDDSADFARNDVVALARARGRAPWGHARIWLDGGTDDPFRSGDEALAAALGIHMRHWPGAHEGSYWRAHYGSYLHFYASALAKC